MADSQTHSLRKIELYSDLSDRELAEVEKQCSWKRFAAQEQIIDRHSETRDVYFIVNGRVRVVNYSLSGREVTLDDFLAGSPFGELAAIDGEPRSASVMALEPTLLASLSHEHFVRTMQQYPRAAMRLMRHLTRMVRASTDRIMDLSTLGANNRVHAELLRQARDSMDGENTAVIRPIPVHGDMASRVSTTRETVARVMNDLARKGIVERRKDALVILDLQELMAMVEDVRGE
ncbi:MAG: Crp/Fnr family transcriptional regulator [Hyphomicrobiales bacterium]|nr:Crp/Fnr family transcriptional regulator [Hyphomicrobiales bacterium]MCP5370777.1 Crp/Fnr family transcriptional regulator [Hyphomicrobiales bacterium]